MAAADEFRGRAAPCQDRGFTTEETPLISPTASRSGCGDSRNGRTSRLLLSNLRLVSTHQPRRQSHGRRGQRHDSTARIGKLVAIGNLWGIPRFKRYEGQGRWPPAHSCPKRQGARHDRACVGGRRRRSLTTAWTDSRKRSLHGNAAPTRSARAPLSCASKERVLGHVTDLPGFR